MANDPAVANTSASVHSGSQNHGSACNTTATALFQKAHAKMVTLQRVDHQLAELLEHRKKLQEELRCCQIQINEEFERVMHAAREGEAHLTAQFTDVTPRAARRPGSGNGALRLEVAESA